MCGDVRATLIVNAWQLSTMISVLKLIEHGLVEALDNAVGLRAFDLGAMLL